MIILFWRGLALGWWAEGPPYSTTGKDAGQECPTHQYLPCILRLARLPNHLIFRRGENGFGRDTDFDRCSLAVHVGNFKLAAVFLHNAAWNA